MLMSETRIAWTHQPTSLGGGRAQRQRLSEQMTLLARAPLFEGLPKTHLRKIARVSAAWNCRAGEELVKEGAAGTVFYVILEGHAKVIRRGRTIKRLGQGDFFGELAILTRAPRSASVVAETPMRCLTLSAADLRDVLMDEPAIAVRMLDTLAHRIADLDRHFTA
jgi:CRP-like cAMP-binding protein